MSKLGTDLAGMARKTGLTVGVATGWSAGSAVFNGVIAAGMAAATPPAAALIGFPIIGGYVGWKCAKKLTDWLDEE